MKETNKTFRIEIGLNAYKDEQNDYAGKVGYVYFCNKCCKDWRIQFFSMGNNELLRSFDLSRCKIFFADNPQAKKPHLQEQIKEI